MKFVSELRVGSFLIYPKGQSAASQVARQFIRYDVKQAREGRIEYVAKRLRELLPGSVLEGILSASGLLVPVPGHTPRLAGALWVAERISKALIAEGIGSETEVLVERVTAVPRSSTLTSAANRPDPKLHASTLRVAPRLVAPSRITLVDDVVTRGSTLIACASLLQGQFPGAEIQAFAIARVEERELQDANEMASPRVEGIRYDETTGWLVRS